jgi:hypothetical protein
MVRLICVTFRKTAVTSHTLVGRKRKRRNGLLTSQQVVKIHLKVQGKRLGGEVGMQEVCQGGCRPLLPPWGLPRG